MIHDETRLAEVLSEISAWNLQQRREYLAEIERAFGAEAAQQLRNGLRRIWQERDKRK